MRIFNNSSQMRNVTCSKVYRMSAQIYMMIILLASMSDFRKRGRTSNDLSNRHSRARFLDDHRQTDKLWNRKRVLGAR